MKRNGYFMSAWLLTAGFMLLRNRGRPGHDQGGCVAFALRHHGY